MKSYEWKMGDPCPFCGVSVYPMEMMDHAKTHDLATGMVFMQRVLYFNLKNQSFEQRDEP